MCIFYGDIYICIQCHFISILVLVFGNSICYLNLVKRKIEQDSYNILHVIKFAKITHIIAFLPTPCDLTCKSHSIFYFMSESVISYIFIFYSSHANLLFHNSYFHICTQKSMRVQYETTNKKSEVCVIQSNILDIHRKRHGKRHTSGLRIKIHFPMRTTKYPQKQGEES